MAEYDIDSLVRDPDFQRRPFEQRRAILQEADAGGFGTLDKGAQSRMLVDMKGQDWWGADKRARQAELAKGAKMDPTEASDYAANRAAFAQEGGVSTFGGKQGGDTRKISYTDSGYRPNRPAKSLKELARNTVQDAVELPLMPVRMLKDVADSPDTGRTLAELGKGVVRGPLEFIPGVGEALGGRSATEAWSTNPGYGALTLAGGVAGGKAIKSGVGKAGSAVLDRVTNLEGDMLGLVGESKMPVSPLGATISAGIDKGIRPSVQGKKTYSQGQQYHQKAQEAVKTILDNHAQGALQLTDEFGEATKALPQNLKQFSQAIEQSKHNIFNQYNQMAVQAGESGAVVELNPIAGELSTVANNKVLQKVSPGTAKYAQERAQAFSGRGRNPEGEGVQSGGANVFTAEEAQQAITAYNQSLESFYKNPSYDTASRAYIDSLIVNHLRKGLDSAIENAGAPGYQALKNQYGALKTIEKDVAHRATVDARKNPKGLLDFSDVFSGGQVVHGLLSMNPATVGTGLASKVIANFYKRLNDPNKIVGNMFKRAERMHTPRPRGEVPQPSPRQSRPAPNEGMAGKVNTGGIIQPGPQVNSMGPVNTGVPVAPQQTLADLMTNINTLNPNAPARFQIDPSLVKRR